MPMPGPSRPTQNTVQCDGDRRDYAKKQWADFVARGGVPERKAAAVAAEAPTGDAAAVAAVRDSE